MIRYQVRKLTKQLGEQLLKAGRLVANQNCHRCYGRGSLGKNFHTQQDIMCRCVCIEIDETQGKDPIGEALAAPVETKIPTAEEACSSAPEK